MVDVSLVTVIRWAATDTRSGKPYSGEYDLLLNDVGATIGVGVYSGETCLHSFYAHTGHMSRAAEIARDLAVKTIDRIVAEKGAWAVIYQFPEVFPLVAAEADHRPLPLQMLEDPLGYDDNENEGWS
jgi:hypothetical protein